MRIYNHSEQSHSLDQDMIETNSVHAVLHFTFKMYFISRYFHTISMFLDSWKFCHVKCIFPFHANLRFENMQLNTQR